MIGVYNGSEYVSSIYIIQIIFMAFVEDAQRIFYGNFIRRITNSSYIKVSVFFGGFIGFIEVAIGILKFNHHLTSLGLCFAIASIIVRPFIHILLTNVECISFFKKKYVLCIALIFLHALINVITYFILYISFNENEVRMHMFEIMFLKDMVFLFFLWIAKNVVASFEVK